MATFSASGNSSAISSSSSGNRATMSSSRSPVPWPCRAESGVGSPMPRE